MDILNRAVTYASGLPLALGVIGSHLFKKSLEEWESALDGYKRIPNKDIQNILKLSFDALGEEEQCVFLDISCCFKGYQLVEVKKILCAHHNGRIEHHIGVLVEKSLIKIDVLDRVTMHDLIEDMGKEIVRQESRDHPGKRSRLWSPKDIIEVLEENTGTAETEMICWNSWSSLDRVAWDGEAFKQMKKLKTLIIKGGHFSKSPNYLPNSLKVLEWLTYPSHVIPSDFHPKKLTIYKFCVFPGNLSFRKLSCPEPELPRISRHTSLEFLILLQKFVNIRILSFDGFECLTTIPDVSSLLNLEEFSFKGCRSLIIIDDSVGLLDKLKVLNAENCSNLKNFPPLKLTSLQSLRLSGCKSLVSFPEILVEMKNITKLELREVNIKEFQFSFCKLSQLRSLSLEKFGSGFQLPSSIYRMPKLAEIKIIKSRVGVLPFIKESEEKVSSMPNLKHLELRWMSIDLCSSNLLHEFLAIGLQCFANIEELDLSGSGFTFIPECIKECHFLWKLVLNYCKQLQEIRGIPPNLKYLCAKGCESLSS